MQRLFRLLYTKMLHHLSVCSQTGLRWDQEAQCGFFIAESCWQKLQQRVCHHRFATPGQEITFFKDCKPLITSEIIYYTHCYQAFLFLPDQQEDRFAFWTRERDRLTEFKAKHAAFYAYYQAGLTQFDAAYFLRENFDDSNLVNARIYDAHPGALTNKDPLIATLLALEKYRRFANMKLQQFIVSG